MDSTKWWFGAGVIALGVIVVLVINLVNQEPVSPAPATSPSAADEHEVAPVEVIPIAHATMVLRWGETVIYTDPVGGAAVFAGQPAADLILVTDVHGDHLNAETLAAVAGEAVIVVPRAVKDMLPASLAERVRVMNNGETIALGSLSLLAFPMYNLPEAADSRHVKGRGNGYVLERDNFRVYIAGDTAGTPEMRALTDIDIAFVPMNLPFTMDVDEAAEAVLAFQPRQVYPYHYRGQTGLSDVNRFRTLVNAGNPSIEVVLAEWYPAQ
jgi:L-ascorbate metabolism protein UlaG (beta-lactamase superfamily)